MRDREIDKQSLSAAYGNVSPVGICMRLCANSEPVCLVEHAVFKRPAGTVAITGRLAYGDTSRTSDLQFLATMHLQLLITVEGMHSDRRRGCEKEKRADK